MWKILLLFCGMFLSVCLPAQIVSNRSVTATSGKDTVIGSTIWAYTVGEAVTDTYTAGNITFTQGFHQPDGFSFTPYIPFLTNLAIYPNPARPGATLRFYLKVDKPEPLNISIYDANGRLYQSHTLEAYAGQTYHSLNPQTMAAGTYQIRVTAGYEKYYGRIVIIN